MMHAFMYANNYFNFRTLSKKIEAIYKSHTLANKQSREK